MIPLRIAIVAFLVVTIAWVVGLLSTPAWPDAAIEYHNWTVSQPKSTYLQALPLVALLLLGVAFFSATVMLFRKRWARWPFAAATGAGMLLNLASVFSDRLPLIVSPLEFALGDTWSLLAGFIVALSFSSRANVAP